MELNEFTDKLFNYEQSAKICFHGTSGQHYNLVSFSEKRDAVTDEVFLIFELEETE